MSTITIAKNITSEAKILIGHFVNEILNDPDFGLQLTDIAKKRLRGFSVSKKTTSLKEIKKKYL